MRASKGPHEQLEVEIARWVAEGYAIDERTSSMAVLIRVNWAAAVAQRSRRAARRHSDEAVSHRPLGR